jgi:hypothetical protein
MFEKQVPAEMGLSICKSILCNVVASILLGVLQCLMFQIIFEKANDQCQKIFEVQFHARLLVVGFQQLSN